MLSSVAAARTLEQTAERFAAVGATALILTKLDEANGLGNVLPMLRSSGLPLSYLTNGQNVPDDIEMADARRLARMTRESDRPETGEQQFVRSRKRQFPNVKSQISNSSDARPSPRPTTIGHRVSPDCGPIRRPAEVVGH